jgi:outer membrane protein OmpA-like peptidoglycan-associated protein
MPFAFTMKSSCALLKTISDERTQTMRGLVLLLGFALMVLTGCQHHSVTTVGEEVGPLLVPQGQDSATSVTIEEAHLFEQEKIFPLPLDVPNGNENGRDASSVSDTLQQPDGRHLPLVLFPYDSWTLTPQAQKILEHAGAWLRTYNHGELSVEGHTDPKGTTAYNYALGLRRASTVIRYLVNLGADQQSMVPASFGEAAPVCHEISAYCDAMNRRAAVFVARREAHPLLSALTDFSSNVKRPPATPQTHD